MYRFVKQLLIDQKRVFEVEDRILKISLILTDEKRRKDFARGVSMHIFEGRLANANRPLIDEMERLEKERLFLIDRRDSLTWRFLWNVVIPIVVSISTVIALHLLGFSNEM